MASMKRGLGLTQKSTPDIVWVGMDGSAATTRPERPRGATAWSLMEDELPNSGRAPVRDTYHEAARVFSRSSRCDASMGFVPKAA